VPTHILDPQDHLRLVTSRFDARARKGHDCTAPLAHVRTGDKQLFGLPNRGWENVQDAHDARAPDEKQRG
jgi:hypothetical protein